ncbi:MAG: hypothetical protein ACP5NZ_02950 [Nanobdellota archaeon]
MFEDLFGGVDANVILLALLFVIFFVIIQLALSRSLKDKSSASIIAFCVSLLCIYGISRTGLDFSEFFYNMGISDSVIYTIIPFIILAGLIYLFWKVKLRFILVCLGIGLLAGSMFVYEKTAVRIIGGICLIVGIILMVKESRRSYKRRQYQTFSR